VNYLKVEFFGKSAHAGFAPWEGRSTLHAAELFVHGLNVIRRLVTKEIFLSSRRDPKTILLWK